MNLIPMVFYHDPEQDLYAAFEEFRLRQEINDVGRMMTNKTYIKAIEPVSSQVVPVPEPADLMAMLKYGGELIVAYKNLIDCDAEDKRKLVGFLEAYEAVGEETNRMIEAGQGWMLPGGEG